MQGLILFSIITATYFMVVVKRVPALVSSFRYQSFFLFLITLLAGFREGRIDLYFVALFVLALKVFVIPYFLRVIARRINVDENLGLFVNAQLSLVTAFALTYLSKLLSERLGFFYGYQWGYVTVAFSMVFIGAFLMVSRMKAFTQVTGMLVMENGVFLLASSISGGMPFFVEIAIFLDVFVSVIIMGLFVYRINKFFTHIDVNRLSRLKG